MKLLLTLLLAGFMFLSSHGQTYIGKQKDIDIILENINSFSAYVIAGDHESIARSYTQDGKIFPGGRMIIEGQEGLMNYWKMPKGRQITYHKIIPSEIKVMGKEAYDYGYYEGKTQNAKGEISSWRGKYVIVWKKVNKDWKIYLDIWNRVEE